MYIYTYSDDSMFVSVSIVIISSSHHNKQKSHRCAVPRLDLSQCNALGKSCLHKLKNQIAHTFSILPFLKPSGAKHKYGISSFDECIIGHNNRHKNTKRRLQLAYRAGITLKKCHFYLM